MSIIVIGGGEVGRFITEQLIAEKKDVVVIEKNERILSDIDKELDAKFILGNGAAPHVLREAGLDSAEMVIAVTDSDEVNLLAMILAGMEAPQAIRIARMRSPEFDIENERFQHDFHIHMVINPDKEAAKTIGRILEVPGSFDTMDFFGGELRLVGTKPKPSSPLIGKKLKDFSGLYEEGHFLLAAIFRRGKLIVPSGDDMLMAEDEIYFVAYPDSLKTGLKLLGYTKTSSQNVMINGAGFIGRNLAESLEKAGSNVKLIESDPKLCSIASRILNKSVILNASGTDQELLEEESVGNMDAFVAVTRDDEDNIVSSLLAKKMGCPLSIAVSHKTAYQSLISTIGIDLVINPRHLSNNAILQFLRRGRVYQASSLRDAAEIMEVEALETSDLVGTPLKEMKLPDGVLVLSIRRGDEIIAPWGDTVIKAEDRVLLISKRESVSKVERFVTVKLEDF